jgi:aerobic carbon-monoxide dehydrogenase medium subunit
MIRTRLRYHRPRSLEEAVVVLAEHAGDVRVLAGGTQLVPRMMRGEVNVQHLVDLGGLGLRSISLDEDANEIEIGAMVTYADVLESPMLARHLPLIPRMASGVTGGRQLTQQATLVGSVALSFPASEMPAILVALGGRVRLHGPDGIREVAATAFLRGAESVDLRPGEFVSSCVVPVARRSGYCKIKHAFGSWPIATASAVLEDNDELLVTLGAVEDVPLQVRVGRHPEAVREGVAAAVTRPWSDVLASGEYRRAIAPVAAARAANELTLAGA